MQFCVLKGYLRRVREYCISLDESVDTNNSIYLNGDCNENDTSKSSTEPIPQDICDGTNDSDSLACSGFGKSYNMNEIILMFFLSCF